MIDKLQNPAFAAAFGIVLSVALGASVSMRALAPLLAKSAVARDKLPPEELKQKGWDFWTIEIENLSTELKGERERLKKQADLMDQRAARLANEEKARTAYRVAMGREEQAEFDEFAGRRHFARATPILT